MENRGAVWSNQTYVQQSAQGENNVVHEVYLGDGIMVKPEGQQLNPEQHRQVIQAIAQNPTIASCFKAAVSKSGGVENPVHVNIPGHEYSLQVSKEDWLASGQTSHTMTVKGTPSTLQTHTPVHHTLSLPATIPSTGTPAVILSTPTEGALPVGPPPGFPLLPEDPLECQATLREQITADGKTLTNASWVLCINFHHMGEYRSQQMKSMRDRQLAGVRTLRIQVIQALLDWRCQSEHSPVAARHCSFYFTLQ